MYSTFRLALQSSAIYIFFFFSFFPATCNRKLYFICILPDQSSIAICTPINIGITNTEIINEEEETFWSPSTAISPHTPPPQNTSHESRSAPPTPNNNKSGTSPPEAAIEATPETTPVKVYKIHLIITYYIIQDISEPRLNK